MEGDPINGWLRLPEVEQFAPTAVLRWAMSHAAEQRLQQAWQGLRSGRMEWRDVPREVVDGLR